MNLQQKIKNFHKNFLFYCEKGEKIAHNIPYKEKYRYFETFFILLFVEFADKKFFAWLFQKKYHFALYYLKDL